MIREKHNTREEWLIARNNINGIGASEAGLICGCEGAFGNIDEIYNTKLGIVTPKEINNYILQGGVIAEPIVRSLFEHINNGNYKVDYNGYDIFRSEQYPFMFCTLDGELTRLSDDVLGIYEGKYVTIRKLSELAKWEGKIPDYYLCQQLHQLIVCDDRYFNILVACLKLLNWQRTPQGYIRVPYNTIEFRFSYIDKNDENYKVNADYVLHKEFEFWKGREQGIRPTLQIRL